MFGRRCTSRSLAPDANRKLLGRMYGESWRAPFFMVLLETASIALGLVVTWLSPLMGGSLRLFSQ